MIYASTDTELKPVVNDVVPSNMQRMPDWSNITETQKTPVNSTPWTYTATEDCWFLVRLYHGGSTNTGERVGLSVNGTVVSSRSNAGYGGSSQTSGPIPLSKGETVTVTFNGYDGSLSGRTAYYTVIGVL